VLSKRVLFDNFARVRKPTTWQIRFSPQREASGAEFEELLSPRRWRFARLVMRGTGQFDHARGAVLPVTTQPFAHAAHGGSKQARSGIDATLTGRFH
jgi:hypothetical protein